MDKISPAVLLQKKSTPTEPCKRMICRRVKTFQTTGSVLVAEGRGAGVGREYKKKKSPSTADITNDWHHISTQLYTLMAWQGTTSPFSFTYTQTEIADTDTRMETNPRKCLHHVAVVSGVSKSSAHTETNI
jgi:hypothetical protein